jgi:hypothetical protein
LGGITSNGRFLVLQSAAADELVPPYTTFVLDNQKPAWATLPKQHQDFCSVFLLNDESSIVLSFLHKQVEDAWVYDLESFDHDTFEPRFTVQPVDGFLYEGIVGEHLIYRKDKEARVYSWLTKNLVASATLPSDQMGVHFVSRDGKIIVAQGWPQGADIGGMGLHQAIIDTTTGAVREIPEHMYGRDQVFAPDGTMQLWFGSAQYPAWMRRFWPSKLPEECLRVRRWAADEELGTFTHIRDACFSPQGNLLAMLRDDGVIAIYAFPFHKPWGWSIAVFGGAATVAWTLCCLWTRFRPAPAAAAPPQA